MQFFRKLPILFSDFISLYHENLKTMEQLIELFKRLLNLTDTTFVRYLHDRIDWSSRMIGITGPRGVGKTTMLLQHIKRYLPVDNTLFVNADDIYFAEHRLFDLASEFYKYGGKHLYIDEIHKYQDWSKELKMIYDYFPDLQVVFTGSSILEIYKGNADLSRRVLSYYLQGLSFREYLAMAKNIYLPVYTLSEILGLKVEMPETERPLALFKEYIEKGYYPFFSDPGYEIRLRNIVNTTVENDIPAYANLNPASTKKIRQLLYVISKSIPFKPNFTKIGQMIDLHRNQVADFMFYLEKAGIIAQSREKTEGVRQLGKVEKTYMDNTNLAYALSDNIPEIGNIRETFFLSQMKINNTVFSSDKADFQIDGITFEIGGPNKGQKQIQGMENAYIVKDEIEYGYRNIIPLWHFGFNY